MNDALLGQLLQNTRRIAIVGLSDKPERDSYEVAEYLLRHGYEIIPVNPMVSEVLGRKAYASLLDIPESVDMVDVFRRTQEVLPIAQQAIQIGARSFWQQLGVVNQAAHELLLSQGVQSVIDRCIKIDHRRLLGGPIA